MALYNNAPAGGVMEYCFCYRCNKIKVMEDLVETEKGLKCIQCGGYNLGEAGWVACPHNKMTAVKCPVAGKGIVDNGSGLECMDRCSFRA